MALQAEMVWAFLAPRTFATDGVMVSAALEPAYEVGGDAYDYSLIGDRLHVSVFDAVGHDLAAGLLASVAMASCRCARRSGGTLQDIVTRAGHAIARQCERVGSSPRCCVIWTWQPVCSAGSPAGTRRRC